jgi:predicted RNA methylase
MGNYKEDNKTEFIQTPSSLGRFMLELSKKHFNNVDEILEPCAGAGALVNIIEEFYDVPILKYDIEPRRDDIIELNFQKDYKKIKYKENRLTIMNPPFAKSISFITKALEISDMLVTLCGANTLINLDWDKYEVLEAYHIKGQYYNDDVKVNTGLFVIKNKND